MAGPVLLSNAHVTATKAHNMATVFAKIPAVLSVPCTVVKLKKGKDPKAKINASIHVQGNSRDLALGARSMGQQPTATFAILNLAVPDPVFQNWRYAHEINSFQGDWLTETLPTPPKEDSEVADVLSK